MIRYSWLLSVVLVAGSVAGGQSPVLETPQVEPPQAETPQAEAKPDEAKPDEAKPDEAKADEAKADEAEPAKEAPETEAAEPEAANAGQPELDQAMEKKLEARDLGAINEVVELLDEALEKGLDEDNATLAKQVLLSTLIERSGALSKAVLQQPMPRPQMQGQWAQIRQFALNDLQRIIELDPALIDTYFQAYRLQVLPGGDLNAARRVITKVIDSKEFTPRKRAEALAFRAVVQTKPERQLADINAAIELQPKKVDYLLLRAKHYQANDQPEKCLTDVDAAIVLEPKNASVHEMKALILLTQKKTELALESFNKASELAPDEVAPYQYRGEVYRQLGDLKKAISQLDTALEKDPDNIASLLVRAELLAADDQGEKALEDIDSALARRPNLQSAQVLRARVLSTLNRQDEAVQALEELALQSPADPQIQLQLGAQLLEAKQPERGIEALSRVIDLAGQNELAEIALRLRGDTYLTLGKHAEAVADFAKVLELNPEESGVLNNFAWTLATSPFDELRDGPRAIELATKACEITEFKQAHILSTLAAAYAEAGKWDKAIEFSEKAVKLGAEDLQAELSKELASYKAKKPWRELQAADEAASDSASPPADEPAPEQTIEL